MLAILSPAKNIRVPPPRPLPLTRPARLAEARTLHALLREIPAYELERCMHISPKLALQAAAAIADWQPTGGAPAILAYNGLVYKHLAANSLTDADLRYAHNHLRHLSSLYGVLRPLDAVHPYRLELACQPRGQNLYEFWGSKLHDDLFAADRTVINLASHEYSKAVSAYLQPGETFITCEFLTPYRGRLSCLSTIAKMARGEMARFLIQNRIDHPTGLMAFHALGFAFDPTLSNSTVYTFVQS